MLKQIILFLIGCGVAALVFGLLSLANYILVQTQLFLFS